MQAASNRVIECAADVFAQNLNRLPYEFSHHLAGNPLFELSRLVDLAEKVATRLSGPARPGTSLMVGNPRSLPAGPPRDSYLSRTAPNAYLAPVAVV